MTTETRRDFRARVRRHAIACDTFRAAFGHICREHPIPEDARLIDIPDEDAASAIAQLNRQPHDPFAGL